LDDIAITPRLDIILSDFSQAANTFSLVLFSGAAHSNFPVDPSADFETKHLQIPLILFLTICAGTHTF